MGAADRGACSLLSLVHRPAPAAALRRRGAARAAPAPASRRAAVWVCAYTDPEDKSGGNFKKEVDDISSPIGLREAARPGYAPAFRTAPLLPAFTRRREVFAGRFAMIGMAAAIVWEVITPSHAGPMVTTAALTGLSIPAVKLIFGGLTFHGVLGLLWPGAPTFDRANVKDFLTRPDGPPTKAISPFTNLSGFLGCSPHFGFTKRNELFHGRLAMLGFFATVVNEGATGMGPIGQVAWWLGAKFYPADSWYNSWALGLTAFALVMTGLAYTSGHAGTVQGEDDIY
ncbi:MAG: hypothetical protein J3K34DRAFT_463283 [Monoraphidium minutum]|nr:MAG: hypothetical protein J3K34DRAFT_463283 [Monoraphidium minutum]